MVGRIDGRPGVDALGSPDSVPERLSYVAQALALLKKELAGTRGARSRIRKAPPGRWPPTWSKAGAPRTSRA